jgi:hypothetical protein
VETCPRKRYNIEFACDRKAGCIWGIESKDYGVLVGLLLLKCYGKKGLFRLAVILRTMI